MGFGAFCSPFWHANCIYSVVESKVRFAIPDITATFPCNKCTQFLVVLHFSKIANTDTIPFQTCACNM